MMAGAVKTLKAYWCPDEMAVKIEIVEGTELDAHAWIATTEPITEDLLTEIKTKGLKYVAMEEYYLPAEQKTDLRKICFLFEGKISYPTDEQIAAAQSPPEPMDVAGTAYINSQGELIELFEDLED